MRSLSSSDKTAPKQDYSSDLDDYRSALDSAVAWLGDRYLLARPVQRLAQVKRRWINPTAVRAPRGPRSAAG